MTATCGVNRTGSLLRPDGTCHSGAAEWDPVAGRRNADGVPAAPQVIAQVLSRGHAIPRRLAGSSTVTRARRPPGCRRRFERDDARELGEAERVGEIPFWSKMPALVRIYDPGRRWRAAKCLPQSVARQTNLRKVAALDKARIASCRCRSGGSSQPPRPGLRSLTPKPPCRTALESRLVLNRTGSELR